jgi:hypothetical protein
MVDVVPASAANTINLDSRGTVSVAVLGSRWFRAADLDPVSLTLGNGDGLETPVARKSSAQLVTNSDLSPPLALTALGRLRSGKHIRGADVVAPK